MNYINSIAGLNCSKSLKIMYFCRMCGSHGIQKCVMYGQVSYLCECGYWESWTSRIKLSRDKYQKNGMTGELIKKPKKSILDRIRQFIN